MSYLIVFVGVQTLELRLSIWLSTRGYGKLNLDDFLNHHLTI